MATATTQNVSFLDAETEDELRAQVAWLEENVGLDVTFFTQTLRVSDRDWRDWRDGQDTLSFLELGDLAALWQVLRSLMAGSEGAAEGLHNLLEWVAPLEFGPSGWALPPWKGGTLKQFLAGEGREGFLAVRRYYSPHQD